MSGCRCLSEIAGILIFSLMIAGCDDSSSTTQKTALGPVIPGPVDADAPEEFTTTESGLKYRIRRKSEGKKPTLFDQVTIHMRGWLDNEEIFQTSYGTGGTPGKFAVKLLPQGVKDGIQHIGEGGMIELEVPPNLAFGEHGNPPVIPGNATLHYLIEVIKVDLYKEPPPIEPSPEEEDNRPKTGRDGPGPGKEDEDAPKDFTATASGLSYRILRKSDGKKPSAASTVTAHYRGWLDDGTVFDETYSRNKPIPFRLTAVIKGWTEGLQLIGEGGMIELEIPGNLGYPEGRPGIPAGATLHFIVELVEVN